MYNVLSIMRHETIIKKNDAKREEKEKDSKKEKKEMVLPAGIPDFIRTIFAKWVTQPPAVPQFSIMGITSLINA